MPSIACAGARWLVCVMLVLCSCSSEPTDNQPRPAADGGKPYTNAGSDADAGEAGAGGAAPSDAGMDSGRAEVLSEAEVCRRYVAYYCERLLSCGITTLQYASACYQSAELCPDLMFSPGSTRTVENVYACAKAWVDHSCDELVHERAPKCGATPGTRELGESCITATQCKSTRCTGDVAKMLCGKCIELAPSGGTCGADVACPRDETCTSGKCTPRALITPGSPSYVFAPGQACKSSYDDNYGGCTLGSSCDDRPGTVGDFCYYPPASGERCYTAYPGTCWGGGNCVDRTCTAVFACPSDTAVKCEKGQVCVCADESCKQQGCWMRRQEGETCALPSMPCADRLECVQGVCKRANLPSRFAEACK